MNTTEHTNGQQKNNTKNMNMIEQVLKFVTYEKKIYFNKFLHILYELSSDP